MQPSLGQSVALLSSDGSVLVVGAPDFEGDSTNNRGHVQAYEWNNEQWIQRGLAIDIVDAVDSHFGEFVGLSNDGSVLAIGAPRVGDDDSAPGSVRVYQFH
jgi:hypothetical protein